jgi:uncharacterized SAM-binding protein YcdF (DUF218 family)
MGGIVLVQGVYFHRILSKSPTPEKSDLIVVFPGGPGRIKAGYQLASSGYAPNLAIPGLTARNLEYYASEYGLPPKVNQVHLGETKSTFDDAQCTREITTKYGYKSIILVTSSYHLPRAYFLLRLLLLGSDVKLHTYGVGQHGSGRVNWGQVTVSKKMACKEMIKFWASIVQMFNYMTKRGLLLETSHAMEH